ACLRLRRPKRWRTRKPRSVHTLLQTETQRLSRVNSRVRSDTSVVRIPGKATKVATTISIQEEERMAAGTTTIAEVAERQRRLELKELLQKQYKWIDRKWDLVFWVTAIFVVAGAADITKQLFAGDWDFWTDWKDPQWWPVITAFATIIIPSALQY